MVSDHQINERQTYKVRENVEKTLENIYKKIIISFFYKMKLK